MSDHAYRIVADPTLPLTDASLQVYSPIMKSLGVSLTACPKSIEAPAHYGALYRFDGGQDKAAILKTITAQVVLAASWYRVDYHACKHRGAGPCGPWTTVATSGAVPVGV